VKKSLFLLELRLSETVGLYVALDERLLPK